MRPTITLVISVLAAGSLHAQGVSIHSHGACPLARNSTGVAEPCADGSAVFYNPAALATQRNVASLGATALYTKATFNFAGSAASFDSEQPTAIAPHAWFVARLTPTIGAGIGIWAPYGLSTKWPLNFEGRFYGYDNTQRAIYIQPTIAMSLLSGRLGIGVGVAAVNGMVELNQRVDLARTTIPGTNLQFRAIGVPNGTDFVDARLNVDDWTATFHVGVQFKASERWSLGARYLHSAKLGLEGTARFRQLPTGILLPAGNPFFLPAGTPLDLLLAAQFESGAALDDQMVASELTMPGQVVAGVRFAATSALKLFFDYQWTNWSDFDQAVLRFPFAPNDTVFLDYHGANTFRIAAEYVPRDQFTIRGGILYNNAAAPDVTVTPLLPEARRTSLSTGLGYRISERLSADAGVEVLWQKDRPGSVRPRENRNQTAADLNVGRYSAHGVFAGITLSYRFGKTD